MASPTFTQLFELGRNGNAGALTRAYALILPDLHCLAGRLARREGHSDTLQPTALVSELFLRFHRLECRVVNRDHFLNLAARSMLRLLIDRGRRKSVRKRLEPAIQSPASVEPHSRDALATRQVWDRLHRLDPKAAEAFWQLEAEGCTINEVATRQKRPA